MESMRPGPAAARPVTLLLGGDLMTGRGIDQILPCPSDPRLHEPYVGSAATYVALAEERSGPIPRPVDYAYVWGDALAALAWMRPDARILNLETSVTVSDDYWPKGINYRMHPANLPCLLAAGIDCYTLANNHVLDFGYAGLAETLATLALGPLEVAGAGRDQAEAWRPAVIDLGGRGRVLVFGLGTESSGIPPAWAATADRPGVALLPELSDRAAEEIARRVGEVRRAGDIVVASIHWGSNWGYEVPPAHVRFAHRLVEGGVDVVHGHSSHHARPIEIWNGRLILYGCGDFLNDYEGISDHEGYRGDLVLMYFPALDAATGRLSALTLLPLTIRNFRLRRTTLADARWLGERLNWVSAGSGFRCELGDDGVLRWRPRGAGAVS